METIIEQTKDKDVLWQSHEILCSKKEYIDALKQNQGKEIYHFINFRDMTEGFYFLDEYKNNKTNSYYYKIRDITPTIIKCEKISDYIENIQHCKDCGHRLLNTNDPKKLTLGVVCWECNVGWDIKLSVYKKSSLQEQNTLPKYDDYDNGDDLVLYNEKEKEHDKIIDKYSTLVNTVNVLITSYREGESISKLLDNIEGLIKENK